MINPIVARIAGTPILRKKEYKVAIRNHICPGIRHDDEVTVRNTSELRAILRDTYKRHTVSLVSDCPICDDLRDYMTVAKDVEKLSDLDLLWLSEKDGAGHRYVD